MTARAPTSDELEAALAQRIADAGHARYFLAGLYPPSEVPAIFFGTMPDKPNAAILINVYNDDRDRDPHTPIYLVQLRFRSNAGDRRATEQLANRVFDDLDDRVNERSNSQWGPIRILHCYRHLRAPAAPDANGRWSRPDSYTITTNPS
ncbi:phage tail terminator protein [Promicromonospora sukumoe]